MKKNLNMLSSPLRKREQGATVIEYALIAALVAVVAIAGFRLLGTNISSKMSAVATAVGTS